MTTNGAAPLTAAAMSRALAAGQVTPGQLLADTLERIGRANARLGAFVHVDAQGAAEAASAAEVRQRRGARIGALDGIPVAVKDNLWVAGMPARWGSRMWADFVPEVDDIAVERLRAAGAVIVGKTNTPEFALSVIAIAERLGARRIEQVARILMREERALRAILANEPTSQQKGFAT